jgi:hypothetical protein
MSRFSVELCQQADGEVHTIPELITEEAQIILEQNTRHSTEQRAKVTPEECIQPTQMNATHQTASRTRHILSFVGTAIGKLKVFQEQVHHLQLPPMEKTYQYCQAVKWKDETANSRCHSGTVVLAPLHDPQEFKQFFTLSIPN